MTNVHTEPNMTNIRKVILEVLEKIVNSGVDRDSKTLGAYYVLGALTLASDPKYTFVFTQNKIVVDSQIYLVSTCRSRK